MTNPYQTLSKNNCLLQQDPLTKQVIIKELNGAINQTDAERIHDFFRSFILSKGFSCVLGHSAFKESAYQMGFYPDTGEESINGLCSNLWDYIEQRPSMDAEYATFVTCFLSPLPTDEFEFEKMLWDILQKINTADAKYSTWKPNTANDPHDSKFAFSFSQTTFFVVGLHDKSSRRSRKFPHPCIAFNLQSQFDDLRVKGKFSNMQKAIRKKEVILQGNINPNLERHEDSAAKQYSGREVKEDNWQCPFKAK